MPDFALTCVHCKQEIEFETSQVEGLEEHISSERRDAASCAEAEFEGWINPSNLRSSAALLGDLSVAIQRGDRAEATILLERVASTLSASTLERVECARFSLQARLPLPHAPV